MKWKVAFGRMARVTGWSVAMLNKSGRIAHLNDPRIGSDIELETEKKFTMMQLDERRTGYQTGVKADMRLKSELFASDQSSIIPSWKHSFMQLHLW